MLFLGSTRVVTVTYNLPVAFRSLANNLLVMRISTSTEVPGGLSMQDASHERWASCRVFALPQVWPQRVCYSRRLCKVSPVVSGKRIG
jgi:hypothetical protein